MKDSELRAAAALLCVLLATGCKSLDVDSRDVLEEGRFTPGIEGPATDAQGNVYAVNYEEEGTVGILRPDGAASLFLRLPEGSVGNGIAIDRAGNMYVADYVAHRIYRVDAGTQSPRVWAEEPGMNQPNDVCVHPSGSLYLSDPNWAEGTGNLWRVGPDGSVRKLEGGMGTTNGIALSPDARYLYVNESVQLNVWRYRITDDGSLAEKQLFHRFQDFGMDGMRCDLKGNLYIARYDKGTVAVLSPEGNFLKEYRLRGRKPSNLTFAGPQGKTCYVTLADRGCFETFEALHPGAQYSDKTLD